MTDKCVVVYDLEYTAWEGSLERNWSGPNEDPEIVQIGAVKIRQYDNKWETIGSALGKDPNYSFSLIDLARALIFINLNDIQKKN